MHFAVSILIVLLLIGGGFELFWLGKRPIDIDELRSERRWMIGLTVLSVIFMLTRIQQDDYLFAFLSLADAGLFLAIGILCMAQLSRGETPEVEHEQIPREQA
jgi:hypothetical protein